jgi:hypothetical protein
VKRSFLPWFKEIYGRNGTLEIKDLVAALKTWEREVDDTHVVYGAGQTPQEIFKEEKKRLKPLPLERWQITSWLQCDVRRDWRIMINCAYYSVPYKLIGKTVQVCVTSEVVRIFFEHQEVALHQKAKEKWEYQRKTEHAPPLQEDVLQCTREGLLLHAEKIGPHTSQLCSLLLSNPSIDKLRPVRCILRLALQYSIDRLENACKRALEYKTLKYESVKNILKEQLDTKGTESEKIVSFPSGYRFVRSFRDYQTKENDLGSMNFKVDSKYGTAMLGPWQSRIADQILDEEKLKNIKEVHDE